MLEHLEKEHPKKYILGKNVVDKMWEKNFISQKLSLSIYKLLLLYKGGLFINAMSEKYTKIVPELRGLDPLIWKMEEEGIWKYVLRLIEESKWPGLFQVCRKLPTKFVLFEVGK